MFEPTLKTTKEIKQFIDSRNDFEKFALKKACRIYTKADHKDPQVRNTVDMSEQLADEFLYTFRWDLFDMHVDDELIFSHEQLVDFIDIVYGIYYTKA